MANLKLPITLINPKTCVGCPLLRWDDNDFKYRCVASKDVDIYWNHETNEYVNRDMCPLKEDSCCGGCKCKK